MAKGILRNPTPGVYQIQYSDNTHCAVDAWTSLFSVSPEFDAAPLAGSEDAQAFFSIRAIEPLVPLVNGRPDKTATENARVIRDTLTQCLVRTNILRPEMTTETIVDVYRLSNARAVVLVPDTNALSTGTLHWLLGALTATQIWLLPVVVSLVTVQTRDAMLKACVDKREGKYLSKALRSRQLINASLSLLERHRERYQVLEVDPQLLRYVRPAGNASGDPDEGDVLEDRLLLEAIHGALRATRSRAEKRVVTSDMLLARMLRAEGLRALFLQTPTLPAGDIPCLRYEPLAKTFVGASLTHLMWELGHTFSNVRLLHENNQIVSFEAYWAGKTADDWADERMRVTWETATVNTTPIPINSDQRPQSNQGSNPVSVPEPAGKEKESVREGRKQSASDTKKAGPIPSGVFSRASLPEVAFPHVIRLAVVLADGAGRIPQLSKRISDATRPSNAIARAAAEVLLRGDFATVTADQELVPNDRLARLIEHLTVGDLDSASALWEKYQPFYNAIALLKERSNLKPAIATADLAKRLGIKDAPDRSERVWRLPVFLGQAWSDGDQVFDGTSRPNMETVREAFLRAFSRTEQDGLSSLADLLPQFCRALRCTPWFAQHVIPALVSEDRLPEVSFQPSAGKKLSSHDQVIGLQGGEIRLQSSPTDRLDIGGRPVFTVLRGATA